MIPCALLPGDALEYEDDSERFTFVLLVLEARSNVSVAVLNQGGATLWDDGEVGLISTHAAETFFTRFEP